MLDYNKRKNQKVIKLLPVFKERVDSISQIYNKKDSKPILDEKDKIEAYQMLSSVFKELPEIHSKGNPHYLIHELEEFKDCCETFYERVGTHKFIRMVTELAIKKSISKIQTSLPSGNYQSLDLNKLVKTTSNYMAMEACEYKRAEKT